MGAKNTKGIKDDQPLPPLTESLPENKEFRSELQASVVPNRSFYCISPDSPTEVIGSLNLNAVCTSTGSRTSVDLVVVIDVSGSMTGEKIDLVKTTLNFLLTQLLASDRVSLVSFSSEAKRLCKLTCCDEQGKQALSALINSLLAGGGTNLVSGLEHSLEILKNRKQINQSSAVILLTDGQDDNSATSLSRAQTVIKKIKIPKAYSIHTFGYGSDHDSRLLTSISETKNGGFYYIENPEKVAKAFANCLGEVMSTLYDNIQVSLETLNCQFPFSLKRVFSETGDNVFTLPGLIRGSPKEVIFVIELHPGVNEYNDEVEARILKANIAYRDVKTDQKNRIERFFEIKIRKESEEKPEVNQDCIVNFIRFKVAEAIKESNELGDKSKMEEARENIDKCLNFISQFGLAEHRLVSILINDLENAKMNYVSVSYYQKEGKVSNLKSAKKHFHKRAASLTLYQNDCQMDIISNSEDYLKNNRS